MRRRRTAPSLARPVSTEIEEELVARVREALLDQSTPAPLPQRLRERMDRLLDPQADDK